MIKKDIVLAVLDRAEEMLLTYRHTNPELIGSDGVFKCPKMSALEAAVNEARANEKPRAKRA